MIADAGIRAAQRRADRGFFGGPAGKTLANRPAPLTFVDAAPPQMAAGGSGYGAYLGTIPDMTGSPGGVRIVGVDLETVRRRLIV